jgi:hypothetical protein
MQSLFVIHPCTSQPGGSSPGHTSDALPGNNIYKARLSILILSKTYLSKRKTLPLAMQGFWLVGLFAKKPLVVNPYFHILAQVLVDVIITR